MNDDDMTLYEISQRLSLQKVKHPQQPECRDCNCKNDCLKLEDVKQAPCWQRSCFTCRNIVIYKINPQFAKAGLGGDYYECPLFTSGECKDLEYWCHKFMSTPGSRDTSVPIEITKFDFLESLVN